MADKSEIVQSVQSYAIGSGGVMLASLVHIADYAQALAIILGCVVVTVRLVHDGLRLIRYIKKGKED